MVSSSSSSSSSSSVQTPQVFINFRGIELREHFVRNLGEALKKKSVTVYIDEYERRGEDLSIFFKRIEESQIAVAIFSSQYTESRWCLDELVKIMECVNLGKLVVIPVFYKVETDHVKNLEGEFGKKFWKLAKACCKDGDLNKWVKASKWRDALKTVPTKLGLTLGENSDEVAFLDKTVHEVLKVLKDVSMNLERQIPIDNPSAGNKAVNELPSGRVKLERKQRNCNLTVDVEMPSIGKTIVTGRSSVHWQYNFWQCACLITRALSFRHEIRLCDDPVLLDNGKMILWSENESGKKCLILSAMNLSIIWGDTPRYWQLITYPESRFEKVAELLNVCWFEISGRTNTHVLSPQTRYSAYILFKTKDQCSGFNDVAIKAEVGPVGRKASRRLVSFDASTDKKILTRGRQRRQVRPFSNAGHSDVRDGTERRDLVKPEKREDGWMEIELGDFFNNMNINEIEIRAMETQLLNWKSGLIIQGIEIRPTKCQKKNA